MTTYQGRGQNRIKKREAGQSSEIEEEKDGQTL